MLNWLFDAANTKHVIDNYLPLIMCVFVVIGGIWTAYKYFKENNKDFYSNILLNVYAPLYEELVKMEYSRKLLKKLETDKAKRKAISSRSAPFITWKEEKFIAVLKIGTTDIKSDKFDIFNLDEKLKEILNDGKMEYAPQDLVSLIECYFFLDDISNLPNYQDEKLKQQIKIRRNIIIGYKNFRRKLGLKDVTVSRFCYSFFGFIFFE